MMIFEKKQEVQPESILLENSQPVDDSKASEILFVDLDVKERPVHFLRGMLTGAAIVIALWICVNFWRVPSGQDTASLDVLKSAIEKCGELTKFRLYFESLADYRQSGRTGRPENFAVMVNGRVEGGFDMSKARVEVFESERRIEVTLPHGRIERTLVNLAKGGGGGFRVYNQQGQLGTRTFSAKERSEIISVSMREIRRRASGEWGIVNKMEENASKVYNVMLGALSCDVSVTFTNEPEKLGMPEGVSGDVMKGGGAFIVRHKAK